jgi:hypothetical protein
VLASLHALSIDEMFKLMVRSGIYIEDGELTRRTAATSRGRLRPTD